MRERVMIAVQDEWEECACRIEEGKHPCSVYVLGATDRGKSTFCRHLVERLSHLDTIALIDGDPGQSTIGPPATLGLAFSHAGTGAGSTHLRFIGSTTPQGHLLQLATGTKRLLEEAIRRGAACTLIDSPGFVLGETAREFQFQMIDCLQPDLLVSFQVSHELETILASFRHHPSMKICRYPIPPQARVRSSRERARYRNRLFSEYFSASIPQAIPLEGIGIHGRVPGAGSPWQHLLIGCCDWNTELLSMGIAERLDAATRTLTLQAPPFDHGRLASIQVGSLTVHPPLSPEKRS
jgi:polynucleotide 5'-hydroxyl-kinase GRC3/NOL9